jgi:hypothetical protein
VGEGEYPLKELTELKEGPKLHWLNELRGVPNLKEGVKEGLN